MAFVHYRLARSHDRGPPVEGDLRKEPGVSRRGGTCWWDVSWQWLPARNPPSPRHILHKDGMELSHSQPGAPPGTDPIPLREQSPLCYNEDTLPSLERASGQNGRLNPVPMNITTEAGALFDIHPQLTNKALLLDFTIVDLCAGSNLGNAACHVGKCLTDAVEWKKNKYRGSFPATYSLLPLAMSTCIKVDSDIHALIKELAIRRVEHRSERHSNESQYLAEGTEIARLRRRFFF